MLAAFVSLALGLGVIRGDLPWNGLEVLAGALYDARARLASGSSDRDARIVVVDIDEASLRAEGAWPWPRRRIARLIEQLVERYGVSLVALDILFPERGRDRAGDRQLIEAVAKGPVVLAQAFDRRAQGASPVRGAPSGGLAHSPPPWVPRARGLIANHPKLAAAGVAGHITPVVAADGSIRRVPPLIRYNGTAYPALPVAALSQLLGQPEPQWVPGRHWLGPAHWLRLGPPGSGLRIPVDRQGAAWIPDAGEAKRFRYVSATEVLAGEVDPAILSGVVVFVGSTALGLADRVVTPWNVRTPGVEVHARFLAGILDGNLAHTPRAAPWLLLAVDGLLALLAVILHQRLGPVAAAGALLGLAGLWLGTNFALWHGQRLALPPLEPLVVALLLFGSLLVTRLSRAERRQRQLYRQFAAYVPAGVIERLAATGADPRELEAERTEITVLFADLRGFTEMAEGLAPEALAHLMQRVFTELTRVVHAHGGTLDKYMGDALMAFWGAPEPDPAHAARAVAAAKAMVARLTERSDASMVPDRAALSLGIGINSGPVTVGNLGSEDRRAYTALGDAVNVASALEELTAEYGEPILMGSATAQALPPEATRALGRVRLRGRQGPVALYAPTGRLTSEGLP